MNRFSRPGSPHLSLGQSHGHMKVETEDQEEVEMQEFGEGDLTRVSLLSGESSREPNTPNEGQSQPARRSLDLTELMAFRSKVPSEKRPRSLSRSSLLPSYFHFRFLSCESRSETRVDWVFVSGSFWNYNRLIGLFPLVITLLLLCYGYYTVIYVACPGMRAQGNYSSANIQSIILHALFILTVITLMRSSFGDPGYLTNATADYFISEMESGTETKRNGSVRACRKCSLAKPDRTHHCRVCEKCVLRMDHHCPWINNCIGYWNHKFFIQFLIYCTLFSCFTACTCFWYFIHMDKDDSAINRLIVMIAIILSGCFGAALVFFSLYSIKQLSENITTIEKIEKNIKNKYDLGTLRNLESVMGPNKLLWLLPIHSQNGDGVTFASNPAANTRPRHSTVADVNTIV